MMVDVAVFDTAEFDVVVVGAAGIDTCVYLGDDGVDLSRDGSFTDNRDGVGQAGGYAARGYAALGYSTAYIGAIGDDEAGAMLRHGLTAEGIDLSACFVDPAGTARSVNLMHRDGRRTGFYDGRGNPTVVPDRRTVEQVLAGSRLVHVNIPNWARQVLAPARATGATVVCDLQDVYSADDPYRADFIAGADVVCFSTANTGEPEPFMRALWQRRPDLIMLAGMGSNGCSVGIDGQVRHFTIPPSDLPVLDTNGAGDALAVGFATALLDGLSIEAAVDRGQRAARLTCSQRTPKHEFLRRPTR
jgi:acarbose 7IV-phosphotransferase